MQSLAILAAYAWGTRLAAIFDWESVKRAIFDWESVKRCPEAALVGMAAAVFSAVWSGHDPYPTPEESRSFVEDYANARGVPMGADERSLVDAAYSYAVAYGARCEYSDEALGIFGDAAAPSGRQTLLRRRLLTSFDVAGRTGARLNQVCDVQLTARRSSRRRRRIGAVQR